MMLFLSTVSVIGQSENLYHKVFTQQEGLILDNVSAMAFDDDGFLWLGGQISELRTIVLSDKKQGLQRFNGATFHTVYFPEVKHRVISVGEIYKRTDGKFYVSVLTEIGGALYLFDPISMNFKKVDLPYPFVAGTSVSKVFSYHGIDYLLTQLNDTLTVNILNKDTTLNPLTSYVYKGSKFNVDTSTQFIPFEDYFLL